MPRDRPVIGGRTGGFSLVELLIVIAACGVLIGVSIPLFVTYHQSLQVTAGAQHVRALLDQTRQLAMDQLVLPTDLTICNLFCSFLLSHFPVVPPGGPPTSRSARRWSSASLGAP